MAREAQGETHISTTIASSSCPLGCRGPTYPLGVRGAAAAYHRCTWCGVAFVEPRPAAASIQRQYLEDRSSPAAYYGRSATADRITFRRYLEELTLLQPGRGRLLDVGCSTGTLLEVAAEMGWDAVGVDPNPQAVAMARARGLRVHQGFFQGGSIAMTKPGFDAVVMSDVIEHLERPAEAVALAHSLLKPRGILLVVTPNVDSFWGRRLQLKPGEHLYLFGRKSLTLVLDRAGFELWQLKKTSRRRDLVSLQYSTTRIGPLARALFLLAARTGMAPLVARLLETITVDQLMAVARRA